ncbi:unnamed protein product, partial [Brenthis ino]
MKLFLYIFFSILLGLEACNHKTCDGCIRDSAICAWCYQDNFEDIRCKAVTDITETWCPGHIMNPKSNAMVTENLDFNSSIGNVVQIRPQKLDVILRPGDSVNFEIFFKRADNYPVDLYFLFDGSETMVKIQNQTASHIEELYKMMYKMTNNVFLGIGSFIDKNALPFAFFKNSTHTYSFQNRLKLNNDLELSKNVLKNAPYGGNYDVQEGVLDALAQVIVCKDEIEWRNESTKIILVITNQPYHTVGDGKYAGIFQPYDGKCYLKNNKYSKELELDYPSVSIINKLASEEEIIVLFAVHNDVLNAYNALGENIRASKHAAFHGNEITKLLKSIYKGIIQSLKLKVNIDSNLQKYVQISFNPDCYNHPENTKCRVKVKEEKKIIGTIKLLEYTDVKNIEMSILFEGIKEKLKINVNALKDCDCKKEVNSSFCNYGGTLKCGVCECYEDRYGEKCHNPNDFSTCIALNTTAICSNHGHCDRGKCSCKEGYEGNYCECKTACPLETDDRCECVCGACKCKAGWDGDLCKCPSPPDCSARDDKICNGRGLCTCGKCECQDPANWDVRTKQDKYCNVSCAEEESCHKRQCSILEPLVLTYLQEDGYIYYDNVNITKEKNLTSQNSTGIWNLCPKLRVDVGCYTQFIYSYSEESYGIRLKIQSDLDYAETYYLLGGVSVLLLILIGLATLIAWKCITDRRDRLEFERFKKEVAASAMCDNPIFQPATNTFQNPAFGKRSFRS